MHTSMSFSGQTSRKRKPFAGFASQTWISLILIGIQAMSAAQVDLVWNKMKRMKPTAEPRLKLSDLKNNQLEGSKFVKIQILVNRFFHVHRFGCDSTKLYPVRLDLGDLKIMVVKEFLCPTKKQIVKEKEWFELDWDKSIVDVRDCLVSREETLKLWTCIVSKLCGNKMVFSRPSKTRKSSKLATMVGIVYESISEEDRYHKCIPRLKTGKNKRRIFKPVSLNQITRILSKKKFLYKIKVLKIGSDENNIFRLIVTRNAVPGYVVPTRGTQIRRRRLAVQTPWQKVIDVGNVNTIDAIMENRFKKSFLLPHAYWRPGLEVEFQCNWQWKPAKIIRIIELEGRTEKCNQYVLQFPDQASLVVDSTKIKFPESFGESGICFYEETSPEWSWRKGVITRIINGRFEITTKIHGLEEETVPSLSRNKIRASRISVQNLYHDMIVEGQDDYKLAENEIEEWFQ